MSTDARLQAYAQIGEGLAARIDSCGYTRRRLAEQEHVNLGIAVTTLRSHISFVCNAHLYGDSLRTSPGAETKLKWTAWLLYATKTVKNDLTVQLLLETDSRIKPFIEQWLRDSYDNEESIDITVD